MRYPSLFRRAAGYVAAGAIVVGTASCTMKSQEAPDLTGPSEFGASIVVTASPDILSQDGVSRSQITVTARGANGEPLSNRSMILDIQVNGQHSEFGTLSQRNITTGGDGTARVLYTAPSSPPLSTVASTDVEIVVTPIGTHAGNAHPRQVTIRVIPVGTVVPPDGLAPYFAFTPGTPEANQTVLFTACGDPTRACAPANNPIAQYHWAFGDGGSDTGPFAQHEYSTAGSYVVTLTVFDSRGRGASTAQQITVAQGVLPIAAFTFSPASPEAGDTVSFNAAGSTAAAGREIVGYEWDFGTGAGFQPGGVTTNHKYSTAGSFTVTLRVTDDAGRQATTSQQVTIVP